MKRDLAILFLLLCTVVAGAESVVVNNIYYNLNEDAKTAEVTVSQKGRYTGKVTIPASIEYGGSVYQVTAVGNSAFMNCRDLSSVVIPNTVTKIGNYAFSNCSVLSSVNIPSTVTAIGSFAFSNCSVLSSVNIPSTVTAIGSFAFQDCILLSSVDIPNSVVKIGDYSFSGCTSLQSVKLPDNENVEMSSSVFSGCSSLKEITVPEKWTTLKGFDGCIALESIYIPRNISSVAKGVFAQCNSLTNIVVDESNEWFDSRNNCNAVIRTADNALVAGGPASVIPYGVTSITSSAFRYCEGLTAIEIPNSVQRIDDSAFYGCRALKTVFIPNSVINLGPQVFSACTSLVTLYIGNSIGTLDNSTFSGCSALTDIYCFAAVAPPADSWVRSKENIFSSDSYGKTVVHVPAGSVESYKSTEPWSYFYNIVEMTEEEMATRISTADTKPSTPSNVYTLDGKRHMNRQKGVNIIGGKKYVVK